MKAAILVTIFGYNPLAFIFDTFDACHQFEHSLERLVEESHHHTPKQIYEVGVHTIPKFSKCISWKGN